MPMITTTVKNVLRDLLRRSLVLPNGKYIAIADVRESQGARSGEGWRAARSQGVSGTEFLCCKRL